VNHYVIIWHSSCFVVFFVCGVCFWCGLWFRFGGFLSFCRGRGGSGGAAGAFGGCLRCFLFCFLSRKIAYRGGEGLVVRADCT
jgi:hypothetical protein